VVKLEGIQYFAQRAGIAEGGIFYNVQPGN